MTSTKLKNKSRGPTCRYNIAIHHVQINLHYQKFHLKKLKLKLKKIKQNPQIQYRAHLKHKTKQNLLSLSLSPLFIFPSQFASNPSFLHSESKRNPNSSLPFPIRTVRGGESGGHGRRVQLSHS